MSTYTMYKTNMCGACKMVEATGVIEELNVRVVNIDEYPLLKPDDMLGSPFFEKNFLTEGGSHHRVTHTGYANTEMLKKL